jgi:LysM repeat protein
MPIKIKKLGQKGGPKGQDKVVPPNKKKLTPMPFKKKSELMGKKPMKAGGMMKKKGMSKGGKLRMVEKDGKKVPFFAADGKGKMAAGGMMKKKGMKKGGMMKKGYAKGGSVKVKSGDTLSQIAKSKGVTLKSLMAANPGIKNANQIRVGQSIKMPTGGKGRGGVYSGMTKSSMKALADDTAAKRAKKAGKPVPAKQSETANKRARVATRLNQLGEINRQRRAADAASTPTPKRKPMGGKPVPSAKARAASSQTTKPVTSSENKRLEALRAKARKRADRRAGGGMMKKKGMAKGGMMKKKGYAKGGMMKKKGMARGGMMRKKGMSKGGVMRGTGAATRGKRFTRAG